MIIKTINYKDFNGVEHTEEHCFHLSKIERMRLDAKYKGGIAAWVTEQSSTGVAAGLLDALEEIIQTAHGVRSEDGTKFIKDPEITKSFVESEAYSEFIWDLFNDEDVDKIQSKISEFLSGVIGSTVA